MMYYWVVVLSVLAASFAQMLLKKGASVPHKTVWGEYINFHVIGGYSLMGLSLLANIFAMSRGVQVKELGCLEALSYLFVPVLSFWFFRERLSVRKSLSVVVIIAGVLIFFL